MRSLQQDIPGSLQSHQVYSARVVYISLEQDEWIAQTVTPSGQHNTFSVITLGEPDPRIRQVTPPPPCLDTRLTGRDRAQPRSPDTIYIPSPYSTLLTRVFSYAKAVASYVPVVYPNRLSAEEAVSYPTRGRTPKPRAKDGSFDIVLRRSQFAAITIDHFSDCESRIGTQFNYFWGTSGHHRRGTASNDCPR